MDLTWVNLIFVVIGALVGNLIWAGIKRAYSRMKWKYQWKCPQCSFQIKTNHPETFEISKSSHNHSRTKEYKSR